MSPEERQLLVGLFERTRSAAASPRDQEAEAFINDQVKVQPAAPYLLTQTVIVQEHALQGANQRIQQLEAQVKELEAKAQNGAGSFLGGLLVGGAAAPGLSAPPRPRPAPPPGYDQPQGGPWGAQPYYVPQGGYAPPPGYAQQPAAPAGGGFLKGALGMAAGVAGGALLANSIQGLFHGGAGGMGGLAGGNLAIGSGHEPATHETVVNNYYGDAAQGQDDDQVQEAGYDDDGVDNGGDSYDV
jgi:uncharacterized protein